MDDDFSCSPRDEPYLIGGEPAGEDAWWFVPLFEFTTVESDVPFIGVDRIDAEDEERTWDFRISGEVGDADEVAGYDGAEGNEVELVVECVHGWSESLV